MVVLKIPNSKLKVYRIKFNGKDLADFDLLPKDLGVPVKVGKDLVASPEFLASRKLSTLAEPGKIKRFAKDLKDLKRLTGRFFTRKDFVDKIQKPKNILKVLPQPKGMGKSRIKFSETQMFFDTEVSIGYAVNALVKPHMSKVSRSLLSPLKSYLESSSGKNSVVGRMYGLKTFKKGAKGVVIRLKADIGRFPATLLAKIKRASKGGLNASDSAKLRTEIVNFIESPKNLKKLTLGSRTASLRAGERELVLKL